MKTHKKMDIPQKEQDRMEEILQFAKSHFEKYGMAISGVTIKYNQKDLDNHIFRPIGLTRNYKWPKSPKL